MRVTAVETAPLIDLPASGGNKSMNGDAAELERPQPTPVLNGDGPMSQEDTFPDIPFADDEEQAAKDGEQEDETREAEVAGEPSCDDDSQKRTPDDEVPAVLDDVPPLQDEQKAGEAERCAGDGQEVTESDGGVAEEEVNSWVDEEFKSASVVKEDDKDEYAEDAEVVGSGLSDDDDDEEEEEDEEDCRPPPTILVSPPNPPKGILKKTQSEDSCNQERKGRRIVFNEMMTVFSDDCPEMQVPAFRPWDLTYSEMCFMYEPPPEYQDWLPFDPPAEYQDSEDFAPLWTRHQMAAASFCANGRPLEDEESEREMCTDFSEMEDDTANSESLPTDEVTDMNDNLDGAVLEDPNANETTVPREQESDDVTTLVNDTSDETEISDDNITEVPFADFQDESKVLDLELDLTPDGDLVRTNSQIRKNIEINALRRSLLRGAEVRRRNAGKRPKSPTVPLSSLEEKLRWLTATDDEEDATVSEKSTNGITENDPQVSAATTTPLANCSVPRKPQRWASEVLYPSPNPLSQPPPTSPYFQTTNNKHPPLSRPSSFDPSMSRVAWEALFQRDIHGSTLSLRNPYPRTERHPNAAIRPQDPEKRHVTAFRKVEGRVPTSDELECFVQQDFERIERIKKRYSLSDEDDPTFGFGRRPSVRGIRPRFGSTTEILQQLQSQMQPPFLASPKNAGSHVTWPYPEVQKRGQAPQHHHRSVVVLPQVSEEEMHHHRSAQCLRIVDPRRTKDTLSPSAVPIPPPPTSNKDERGTPEGASSSPKISSDSLYHHHQHHHQQPPSSPPKEAVIYYSMNV